MKRSSEVGGSREYDDLRMSTKAILRQNNSDQNRQLTRENHLTDTVPDQMEGLTGLRCEAAKVEYNRPTRKPPQWG